MIHDTFSRATMLAKKGFHVFPLAPGSKVPEKGSTGFNKPLPRDSEYLERIFKDRPELNLGISTSHFGDWEYLVAIDVDNKGNKKGDETLLQLELEGFDLPLTFEQKTPTGGRHLVFKAPFPLKQGVNVLGDGLDIRAQGGYIVGLGSTVPQGIYKAVDREIAQAPQWLIDRLGPANSPKPKQETKTEAVPSTASDVIRAIHYLENEAPEAIEGNGGDLTTYKVAARVKDFGVDKHSAVQLMSQYWFGGCGWSIDDLKTKVEHAYKYGNQPVGSASPSSEFKPIKADTSEKSFLDKMNENYALIFIEGSHYILQETVDEKGFPKRNFLTEAAFKRKFSPSSVQRGKGRALTEAEIWLDWDKRREFAGLCFTPEREPRHNYYNLWRGFTVEPITRELATEEQKRGVDMFLEHALQNVCGNDKNLFKWLMGYFAHIIQRPYERPLTTLVFKGSKGTGKNVLCDRIGKLLGRNHYLVAQDGRYLTSNFNGHMDAALMLVLDEAFWSGDKSAEGKLKGVTTSEEIMIERKGKEPYMVDNLVRLVVIGNEDWLVPASADERRYGVFQMGEGRKQDTAYFAEMKDLIDNKGGAGLLLHYLKSFDLSEVDVNVAPKTEALMEQKVSTFGPLEAWWHGSLKEGRLLRYDFPSEEWEARVSKATLRGAYKSYCLERNIRTKYDLDEITFGRKFKEMVPLADSNQKIRENDKRLTAYDLPTLELARKDWEKRIGHEVKW